MYIDSHQHFWNYHPAAQGWIPDSMDSIRRSFAPAGSRAVARPCGVGSVIAVQAQHSTAETAWLLDLAKDAWIRGVVGWVDLRSPDARGQLAMFASNPKFIGVRHVVQGERDPRFLDDEQFNNGVSLLAEFDLSYDILITRHAVPAAAQFARRHPRQRFVLDHGAKPDIVNKTREPWAAELRELARCTNVYCKLSGLVTEAAPGGAAGAPLIFSDLEYYYKHIIDSFGPGRVMFGSDWPVCLPAADYGRMFEFAMMAMQPFSVRDRERMLRGTCEEFYRVT